MTGCLFHVAYILQKNNRQFRQRIRLHDRHESLRASIDVTQLRSSEINSVHLISTACFTYITSTNVISRYKYDWLESTKMWLAATNAEHLVMTWGWNIRRSAKAKFHYAILVAHRSEVGRRPAASCNLEYHLAS